MSGHFAECTLGVENVSSEYVNGTDVMNVDGFRGRNNGVCRSGERCCYSRIDNGCLGKERFTD